MYSTAKKIFKQIYIIIILLMSGMITSCATTGNNINTGYTDQMTVATVQKEIKIGMSSSDVIQALGSPNIITTDSMRRETWVYDKMSTEITIKSSSGGAWLLIFGGSGSKYSSTSSQRTLTIIIKFDEKGLVRDFAYRTSSF